jgi:hypothetical protein
VDLLERTLPASALRDHDEGGVSLSLRPFQIVTVRLRPRRPG